MKGTLKAPIKAEIDTLKEEKLDKSSVLTFEEMQNTTNLNGKIPDANAFVSTNKKVLWRIWHSTIQKEGTALKIKLPTIPIDCGLVAVSFRGTKDNSGGSVLLNMGFFPQLLSVSSHNDVSNDISILGNNFETTITFGTVGNKENDYVNVSVAYLEFNYTSEDAQ